MSKADKGSPFKPIKFSAQVSEMPETSKNRWVGLQYAIEETKKGLAKAKAKEQLNAREKLLFSVQLENLRSFSHRMLEYFGDENVVTPTGLKSIYALNLVLNQASLDLSAIQQVIAQRITFPELLRAADNLADQFLKPAVTANLFQGTSGKPPNKDELREPRPQVLTYLYKAPTIRNMPYSPVALISLPHNAVGIAASEDDAVKQGAALDFLSLAHEVGHLVFWKGFCEEDNAKFASSLNRKLQRGEASPYIADGAEEIVADAYGAQVAGLPIFYTSQKKAATRQHERYFAANARYMVIPELRPSIYETLLTLQGNYDAAAITPAREAWQNVLTNFYGTTDDQNDNHPPKTVMVESGGYRISYQRASAEICDVVRDFIYPALKHIPPYHLSKTVHVNEQAILVAEAKEIKRRFVNASSNTPKDASDLAAPPPDLGNYDAQGQIWNRPEPHQDGSDYWKIWCDRLIDEEKAQQAAMGKVGLSNSVYEDEAALEWFTVLYAGGWVLESPGNGSGPR